MFETQIDPGEDNTDREDPFRNIERYDGLNFTGPFIESEEVDSCEGIDTVNCDGYNQTDPEIAVCQRLKAGGRFEIVETLRTH
jgi:hypothetical protein